MSKKVLIAMSGGIDSSIAAILLKEKGYNLVGVTFRTWDYISDNCMSKKTGCCDIESLMEAKSFAESLGFEHHILDLRETFKNTVIKYFIDEYLNGKTPNPCIVCNSFIKWGELRKFADSHNCEYIATGHYATIKNNGNRYYLAKGVDKLKDQSYFLWNLTTELLEKTLFPLGKYTKEEIRKMAEKFGLKKLVEKRESQEICFIPDNDYRKFLIENVPGIEEKLSGGNFIDKNYNILGNHKGYPFYTIGQRKGLKIAVGHPLYVTKIFPHKNLVMLGEKEELLSNSMMIKDYNLNKYAELPENKEFEIKIRYRSEPVPAKIIKEKEHLSVKFLKDVSAITPGQSAVIYEGDDLVGGGIIC
ncbi:MAG: tRNA 2-thiouridine(34) synthase MnmA [Marinilabiliales bacterium]